MIFTTAAEAALKPYRPLLNRALQQIFTTAAEAALNSEGPCQARACKEFVLVDKFLSCLTNLYWWKITTLAIEIKYFPLCQKQ